MGRSTETELIKDVSSPYPAKRVCLDGNQDRRQGK